MRKLFSKFSPVIIACFLSFSFFLPKLLQGKFPIPADSLLGLYHPWRDLSIDNYNTGKFPIKNPLITDPVLQTYPWRALVISNFKKLEFPLWNPYSFSGQPLLANIQSSSFQIFNLLFFFMPFRIAWSLAVILIPILSTFFMYLFLRSLDLSKIASVFGSLVLPFTGFFMVWLSWGTVVTAALWLPLILYAINKFFKIQSILWLVLLAFALSQTVLVGHWQTALYTIIVSSFYAAFKFLRTPQKKILIALLVVFFLGLTSTAIQLLPSFEFIKFSSRNADQGYFPKRLDWFLPIKQLAQIIAPDYFGNPTTYNYSGIWNYAEFVSYVGIIPLFFVIFSLFKIKKSYHIFFIVLSLISIALALKNPISIIPYKYNFPLLSTIQPSRIIFVFTFSLVVLASIGLDQFLRKFKLKQAFISALPILIALIILVVYSTLFKNNFPHVDNVISAKVAFRNTIPSVLLSLALIVVLFLYYLKITKNIIILLILLITIFELFRFSYKFTPFSKLAWIYPDTKTTVFLSNIPRPFRIITTDRRIFNGNTSSVYKLENVAGYDPLFLSDYAQLVTVWESGNVVQAGSFNRFVTPQKYNTKIANFLNTKYVITFDNLAGLGLEKIHEEGETKIYENKNALPRAFFVNEVVKVNNRNQELEMLIDENFDLKTSAASSEFSFLADKINGTVNFIEYEDQSFKINVKTDKRAPLVISNPYYPGWEARIDNHISDIKRVNYMFQSIMIPEGEHVIKFTFKPSSFYNGLYISLGSVLLLAIFLAVWKRNYQ